MSTLPPIPDQGLPSSNRGNLFSCPDCGRAVSQHADRCPGCGRNFSRRRRHGVFYYVFWGVVSLIATCGILSFLFALFGVGLVSALLGAGRAAAAKASASSAAVITTNGSELASALVKTNEDFDQNAYNRQHLQLYDIEAKYFDAILGGRTAGLRFKLRNTGSNTLVKVEITAAFQGSNGISIAEEKFEPVSQYGLDSTPLKPGYIWQLESGRFYSCKHVPSEWKEGSAKLTITDIAAQGANSTQ